MTEFAGERNLVIQAPVPVVYDYVSDFARHPEWNHQPTKMTRLTAGPVGVGTRFRTVERPATTTPWYFKLLGPLMMKLMGTSGYTEAEITALEPNRRIAWRAEAPLKKGGVIMKAEWEIRLQPQGAGTRVSQSFRFMPQGKLAMDPESGAKMTGDEVARNLVQLKSVLEAETAQAEAGGRTAFA